MNEIFQNIFPVFLCHVMKNRAIVFRKVRGHTDDTDVSTHFEITLNYPETNFG